MSFWQGDACRALFLTLSGWMSLLMAQVRLHWQARDFAGDTVMEVLRISQMTGSVFRRLSDLTACQIYLERKCNRKKIFGTVLEFKTPVQDISIRESSLSKWKNLYQVLWLPVSFHVHDHCDVAFLEYSEWGRRGENISWLNHSFNAYLSTTL